MFEAWDLWSLVLHSTTAPRQLLVFTFDNFRNLNLVQGEWWWYCSDLRDFLLATLGFVPKTSRSLVLHSTTALMVTSGFHLWQFQVFNSGAERLVVVIVLIVPVRDIHFGHTGVWTQDLWISSPALYNCTTATSGFHLWQFQVFNSVQRDWWWYCFWLDLWEISFWPHWGLNPGPLYLKSLTLPLCHSEFSFSPLTISGI